VIAGAFALMFIAGAIAGWVGTVVYVAVYQPSWASHNDDEVHP